ESPLQLSHLTWPIGVEALRQVTTRNSSCGGSSEPNGPCHRAAHVDRSDYDQEQSGAEPDSADDQRVVRRRARTLVAGGAQRRLGREETIEVLANRLDLTPSTRICRDARRFRRVPPQEVHERDRVIGEVGLDL